MDAERFDGFLQTIQFKNQYLKSLFHVSVNILKRPIEKCAVLKWDSITSSSAKSTGY